MSALGSEYFKLRIVKTSSQRSSTENSDTNVSTSTLVFQKQDLNMWDLFFPQFLYYHLGMKRIFSGTY